MELHDKFIVINDSGLGGTKLHEETEHNPQAPELYVAPTSPRTRLEYNSHRPELYAAPTSPRTRLPEPYSQDTVLPADATSRKRTSWWKEHFWLFVVTLLVLAALIGGVVGGLINRHHSSDKFDSPASSSSATGTKSPQLASFASPSFSSSTFSADGSDSPALLSSTTGIRSSDLAGATSTSLPSSTLYSAPSGTPSLLDSSPLNSSLASVAWLDDGGVGHRRLYYQDSAGTIKESWWNSTAAVWYRSTVAMGKARLNSPLAAAVVGPKKYNFVGTKLKNIDRGQADHGSNLTFTIWTLLATSWSCTLMMASRGVVAQ